MRMDIITTENTESKLPWYRTVNKDKQTFLQHYKGKDHQEAVKDLLLPAIYHVGEIIHSENKPPQVRLQAAQIIINKCISDKIDIVQQKQVVDINKLIDQAMAIRSITQDKDVIDKSPVSCKDDNNE